MRSFVCLLDLEGHGIAGPTRRAYEALPRSRRLNVEWQSFRQAAVLLAQDDDGDAMVACDGDCLAVGIVRLDNKDELEQWSDRQGCGLSDLELVLRAVHSHGVTYIPKILGDFSCVVWNAATRTVVAAVDPFAVRKLYYAQRDGLLALASRGEALALGEAYDVEYLAQRVAACRPLPERTAYAGVKRVPASTVLTMEGGKLTTRQYWSPADFTTDPTWVTAEREAAETCRKLLGESVRLRLSGNGDTWAQLSGGIDSSSVVSVAQWLVERGITAHGLAGTATLVDTHSPGGDEREYATAVVKRWSVRNETIVDPPMWHDDRWAPPHIDDPSILLVMYPHHRRICDVLRQARGRVLLTGIGGDELFAGTMLFFADWLVQGRVWSAVREMARRAAMGRVSFWELAYRNAVLPLLPQVAHSRRVQGQWEIPSWVTQTTSDRYNLRTRETVAPLYAGRRGHKYHDTLASTVAGITGELRVGPIEDAFDVRHPFLYRPLVEFALRLPPQLCARPQARKWIVREAMRGILPDVVRQRVGKGGPGGPLASSLSTQHRVLRPLVHNPTLADLGIVDTVALSAAFAAAKNDPVGRRALSASVQATLIIEAWLQIRSGRWPPGGHLIESAVSVQ